MLILMHNSLFLLSRPSGERNRRGLSAVSPSPAFLLFLSANEKQNSVPSERKLYLTFYINLSYSHTSIEWHI